MIEIETAGLDLGYRHAQLRVDALREAWANHRLDGCWDEGAAEAAVQKLAKLEIA